MQIILSHCNCGKLALRARLAAGKFTHKKAVHFGDNPALHFGCVNKLHSTTNFFYFYIVVFLSEFAQTPRSKMHAKVCD